MGTGIFFVPVCQWKNLRNERRDSLPDSWLSNKPDEISKVLANCFCETMVIVTGNAEARPVSSVTMH